LKNPATYEAYDPSIVGGMTTLVLGKHSGRNAVRRKLLEHSIPIQDNFTIEKILKYVQGYSIQNSRSLTDEEFVRIARGVIMNERKKAHY
ncbi:MAG TPA: homoaconitate hydratase, partial [Lachnospiraceae bacterium]|nr:homoaconitate hydratase [Lachnospiraceae bacterium]